MLISKTFPIGDYVYEYVQLSKPVNRETNNGGGGRGQQHVYLQKDLIYLVFSRRASLQQVMTGVVVHKPGAHFTVHVFL